MKSVFKSVFIIALSTLIVTSCSESESVINEGDNGVITKSASTSLLLASPNDISFSNAVVGETYEVDVTVVSAGLTSLTVLTAFDVIVQGADAAQFKVVRPSLSLAGLLEALLGNGYTFKVSYTPTKLGTSTATILVNASILGILLPTQLEIPVTGTTASGPQLVTNPANGGTARFIGYDSEDPTLAIYEIEILFDRVVTLVDSTLVTEQQGTPGFFKRVWTRAKALAARVAVVVGEIEDSLGTITIKADALLDENNDPLPEDIIFDLIIINPSNE